MTESASDRYRRLADRFSAVVTAVPDDAWDARTPCDEWTVRDVVDHLVTTERDFLVERGRTVPDVSDDPVGAWPAVRNEVQNALDDPAVADAEYDGYFGPTTLAASIDTFFSLDLSVHAWDIARSAGLEDLATLDPVDVRHFRTALESAGDTVRMPGVFGPPVEVADDASEQDRFLAWTGRTP